MHGSIRYPRNCHTVIAYYLICNLAELEWHAEMLKTNHSFLIGFLTFKFVEHVEEIGNQFPVDHLSLQWLCLSQALFDWLCYIFASAVVASSIWRIGPRMYITNFPLNGKDSFVPVGKMFLNAPWQPKSLLTQSVQMCLLQSTVVHCRAMYRMHICL